MSFPRCILQLLVVAFCASLGMTEQPIKSIITGYGIRQPDAWTVLTQISGYASSSNTLSTGAQGSEHSATFSDPGDCATNTNVYPIGTLIYVVVSANTCPSLYGSLSPFLKAIPPKPPPYKLNPTHKKKPRDSKNTSPSKTSAAPAVPNPNPTSTSGWAYPATATKPNSASAPGPSPSPPPQPP